MPFKSLRNDILLVLTIKCLLLFFLWKICFAHPIADQLKNEDVVKHLIVKN
jgi:hypothetical protein